METDQVEQIDVLLSQSTQVLNNNHDTEETDTSTTSKVKIGPCHFLIIKTLI